MSPGVGAARFDQPCVALPGVNDHVWFVSSNLSTVRFTVPSALPREPVVDSVLPRANSEGMRLHFAGDFSTGSEGHDAVVIVVWCLAGSQTSLNLPNVSLLKLPPYSPELNPMEQVWQWLKQHYLSNRCFKDYTEIVDACCMAWNQFPKRTQLIQSIGTRKWATRLAYFDGLSIIHSHAPRNMPM